MKKNGLKITVLMVVLGVLGRKDTRKRGVSPDHVLPDGSESEEEGLLSEERFNLNGDQNLEKPVKQFFIVYSLCKKFVVESYFHIKYIFSSIEVLLTRTYIR